MNWLVGSLQIVFVVVDAPDACLVLLCLGEADSH